MSPLILASLVFFVVGPQVVLTEMLLRVDKSSVASCLHIKPLCLPCDTQHIHLGSANHISVNLGTPFSSPLGLYDVDMMICRYDAMITNEYLHGKRKKKA